LTLSTFSSPLTPLPPRSPLFPYTTLFRSLAPAAVSVLWRCRGLDTSRFPTRSCAWLRLWPAILQFLEAIARSQDGPTSFSGNPCKRECRIHGHRISHCCKHPAILGAVSISPAL